MTPFDLLSRPVREFIFKKGWMHLTDIQEAAITRITQTSDNYILEARTASGKTEAAFFPAISLSDFAQDSVQILYISPLKALINDQMNRVIEMCSSLDIPITKWHGDANQSEKRRLLTAPGGIMLITPESIEAMFQEHPERVSLLFSGLRFVIIDEIHSYLGNDRGVHLRSLLSRMKAICETSFRMIALSATLGGNYDEVRSFIGDNKSTRILRDRTIHPIDTSIRYFKSEDSTPTPDLILNLYESTKDKQALAFSNSRYCSEYVTHALLRHSNRHSGHGRYFSHHSSIDKSIRELVESKTKNSQSPFVISCTSTLELGIDIGELDTVIQIGAPHSSSSLIQRAGRSGRRHDKESHLIMYLMNSSEVLQGTACWSLLSKHIIDITPQIKRPYNCLVHQILSTIKEREEVDPVVLLKDFKVNWAFHGCDFRWLPKILSYLCELNVIELLSGKIIMSRKGEKITRESSFYTMFIQSEEYDVFYDGFRIGSLCPDKISIKDSFVLAAMEWKVVDIDHKRKQVTVVHSDKGMAISYFDPSTPIISSTAMLEMLDIVTSGQCVPTLDRASAMQVETIRQHFKAFSWMKDGRTPYSVSGREIYWYPFVGTKTLNAISVILGDLVGSREDKNNGLSFFTFSGDYEGLIKHIKNQIKDNPQPYSLLNALYQNKDDIFWESVSKYTSLLPYELKLEMILQRWYDFPEAIDYLEKLC